METELLCQLYPYYRLLLHSYKQQVDKREFYESILSSRKLRKKDYKNYVGFYVATNHTINRLVAEMQFYETDRALGHLS
jgi:hypothetical protein